MTEYHWYDEVPPERPLCQGDVIEECPVAVFDDQIQEQTGQDQLVEELRAAVAVEKVRAVVMTQQCDLEYKRVRNVILCPIYHLAEYRERWDMLSEGHPRRQRLAEKPVKFGEALDLISR